MRSEVEGHAPSWPHRCAARRGRVGKRR